MASWYSLENFRCPVAGCDGGQGPNKWICYDDRSLIKIAQTGYLKCSNNVGGNAAHYGQICQWRWDCGRHGDHPFNRFQEADYQGFVFALSHAVQLTTTAGATWVATLCAELEKQYQSIKIKPQVYNSDRTHGNSIERNVTDFQNPHGYNQGSPGDIKGVTQREHVLAAQHKTAELDRQFEDTTRRANPPRIRFGDVRKGAERIRSTRRHYGDEEDMK